MTRPAHIQKQPPNGNINTKSESTSDSASDSESESTSTPAIPLEKQAVFGAGLKRKRITFVPAGAPGADAETQTRAPVSRITPAQRYWTIVSGQQTQQTQAEQSIQQVTPPCAKESGRSASLSPSAFDSGHGSSLVPAEADRESRRYLERESDDSATEWTTEDEHEYEPEHDHSHVHEHEHANNAKESEDEICPICHLRKHLTTHSASNSTAHAPSHAYTHESLLAHQVSLPHVHPPSALDRRRKGVRYLAAWGWDMDSRTGLGKSGTGRRDIVRVVNKQDTLGLGVEIGKDGRNAIPKKKPTLNARQARALAVKSCKQADELRARIFGQEDEVERIMNGT